MAYCHIRGGSELGAEWYEQVRSKNKFRTVQDLLVGVKLHLAADCLSWQACVELLHSKGYSSPSKTAGIGASAGGMRQVGLYSQVVQRWPSFRSGLQSSPTSVPCVGFEGRVLEVHRFAYLLDAKVPFVDVLQTMLDENLPLTAHEQDEWGDPINDLGSSRNAFNTHITGRCI